MNKNTHVYLESAKKYGKDWMHILSSKAINLISGLVIWCHSPECLLSSWFSLVNIIHKTSLAFVQRTSKNILLKWSNCLYCHIFHSTLKKFYAELLFKKKKITNNLIKPHVWSWIPQKFIFCFSHWTEET